MKSIIKQLIPYLKYRDSLFQLFNKNVPKFEKSPEIYRKISFINFKWQQLKLINSLEIAIIENKLNIGDSKQPMDVATSDWNMTAPYKFTNEIGL